MKISHFTESNTATFSLGYSVVCNKLQTRTIMHNTDTPHFHEYFVKVIK